MLLVSVVVVVVVGVVVKYSDETLDRRFGKHGFYVYDVGI